MADNVSITINNQKDYQQTLLKAMVVAPVFEQFGMRGKVTGTKYVAWNRVNRITPGTPATLGLGKNPSPLTVTPEELTATVDWYGAYAKIPRQSEVTDPNGQVKGIIKAVGTHGNETREIIIRDALHSAVSSVYYANNTSRTTVVATPSVTDLRRISRSMFKNGATKITKIIKGGSGENTYPIPACYVIIAHPDTQTDWLGISGFLRTSQYAEPNAAFIGELGTIDEFRVIISNQCTYIPGSASAGGAYGGTKLSDDSSHCNVYPCLIFGEEAFGVSDLEKLETILKSKEQAGGALNMFSTAGYLMAMVAKLLNGNWCYQYEVAASI